MVFMSSRREQGRKVLNTSNNMRCTTVIAHVNRNESNNLNTSNNDNVIGASKLHHIKFQHESPFDTLVTL